MHKAVVASLRRWQVSFGKEAILVNFHGALLEEGAVTTKFRSRTKLHLEGQSEVSETGTQLSWAGGEQRNRQAWLARGASARPSSSVPLEPS